MSKSQCQLLEELKALETKKQQVLTRLKDQAQREVERADLFAEESHSLIMQFTSSLWNESIGRGFDLHQIFRHEFKFKQCVRTATENEIEFRIPQFYDAANPGRWKLARYFFWIVPSINQNIVSSLVESKRRQLAGSLIGDGQRTSSVTYVFLARRLSHKDDPVRGGKISEHEFVFAAICTNPKLAMARLATIALRHVKAQFRTLYKSKALRLRDVGLRNIGKPRPSGSTLQGDCKYNASLLLWSGRSLGLSPSITKTILALMRTALAWDALRFHRSEACNTVNEDLEFTISKQVSSENIVNSQSTFRSKRPDQDGVIIESWEVDDG